MYLSFQVDHQFQVLLGVQVVQVDLYCQYLPRYQEDRALLADLWGLESLRVRVSLRHQMFLVVLVVLSVLGVRGLRLVLEVKQVV